MTIVGIYSAVEIFKRKSGGALDVNIVDERPIAVKRAAQWIDEFVRKRVRRDWCKRNWRGQSIVRFIRFVLRIIRVDGELDGVRTWRGKPTSTYSRPRTCCADGAIRSDNANWHVNHSGF